jgi:hypothetical protein
MSTETHIEVELDNIELPPADAYEDEPRGNGKSSSALDDRQDERLRLQTLDEFDQRPQVTWLVRDLLHAECFAVMFGAPKSGKTYAALDLAMHAAHGMSWHGHAIPRPLRVVYLGGEGHTGLRVRLHAWRHAHKAPLRGDMRILPAALALLEERKSIAQTLQEVRPDVVFIDTLNAYFGGGDENSTQDMTAWVNAVRQLRDSLGCAVVVIHHTGHADQSRERGSIALRGAADVVLQVARDESGSGLIGVQVVAARDMDAWTGPLSLRLKSVTTDWADDEGQPLHACIVEKADQAVTLPGRARRSSPSQAAILSAAMALAGPDGLVARIDLIQRAMLNGISRTAAYRAMRELAPRMGWQFVEPGSLRLKKAQA